MKKLLSKLLLLILFFIGTCSYGQLPAFTLDVTATAQTCLGNGSLSFTVTGNDPAASMEYDVYLLPNTTIPVVTTTGTTVNNLVAGNYQVVATQSLGTLSNTSTDTVTIDNLVVPLTYNLDFTQVKCGGDGVITINVATGTAVSFEIISGPATAPAQASNIFTNLPVGFYEVRAYDNCNNAIVSSVQVTQVIANVIIDPPSISGILPSCSTVSVDHFFATILGNQILFPLTFEFTVYPPGGGAPAVVTKVVAAGNNDDNHVAVDIPFYNDQEYSYDLKVTDACGNVFTRNDNIVDHKLDFFVKAETDSCENYYFSLTSSFFKPPYIVDFLSAPAGFDPASFNSLHPSFSDLVVFYGSDINPVPVGTYNVQITDDCGTTATRQFTIIDEDEPVVIPSINPQSCGGQVSITTLKERALTSVIITAAPPAYTAPLPHDVSGLILNGGFIMQGLPFGTYTFEVTDECGNTYVVDTVIEPAAIDIALLQNQRAGCAIGEGSIRLQTQNNALVTVIITAAPASFTQPLPYDVSFNVVEGDFFMNSLPEGVYTFQTFDNCGFERTEQITIVGYSISHNEVNIIANCGSFFVDLNHASNGNYVQSFWLQKYDEATMTWGHPLTGVPYIDGELPTHGNSKFLTNNQVNINNDYTGEFRILKAFHVYRNGSVLNHRCTHEIYTFTFDGVPAIVDAYTFPCENGLSEVIIEAIGVAPLTYEITTKDGLPFAVNNGTSNLFSGLEEGIYNFRVTDDCNNFVSRPFEIGEANPIEIEADGFCDGEVSTLSVQQFAFLTYEWRKNGSTTVINTTSTLTFPAFDPVTDAGTYTVTITATNPGSCINQELEYEVTPNALPTAGPDDEFALCNDGIAVDLTAFLSAPHDNGGSWEDIDGTGALDGSTLAVSGLSAGTYAFRYVVTNNCGVTDDAVISIELKDIPQLPALTAIPSICEGDAIQLGATAVAGATYQWTGPAGFTSAEQNPLIPNAGTTANGIYSLTIMVNDCASPAASVQVTVNPMPLFNIEGSTVLCEGQSSILTVMPDNFDAGDVTYAWYHDQVLLPDVTNSIVEVFEIGTYNVLVNNDGCVSNKEIIVTLNDNAFNLEPESGCVDYNYILSLANIDDVPGAEVTWSGPGGFSFAGPEADITNLEAGIYTVTVTNNEGCTEVASIEVLNTACEIPRGISPNGDGLNDSFDLSNLDIQEIKIFNRYGLKVYEAKTYFKEWYGQSDKGDLPAATYYYVLTLSAGKQVTGWVYLQREL